MIGSCMNEHALREYAAAHRAALEHAIEKLDPDWIHSPVLARLLRDAMDELDAMAPRAEDSAGFTRDRKTEKYTNWVEVMRLASFQYERFSQSRRAKTEGLYATLLALASTWSHGVDVKKILVPGCGPGRSVLDFARAYPNAQVTGLDYSFLSLMLGQRIVCGTRGSELVRRDVDCEEDISQILQIPGFGLENAEFCLCDLVASQLPRCDMIVCSNTLNLLPDHRAAAQKLSDALNPGGVLIFADLTGWRLDREKGRKILRSDRMIRETFENAGLVTLDQFRGVPYIESESDDQNTVYYEHFYVGRKERN